MGNSEVEYLKLFIHLKFKLYCPPKMHNKACNKDYVFHKTIKIEIKNYRPLKRKGERLCENPGLVELTFSLYQNHFGCLSEVCMPGPHLVNSDSIGLELVPGTCALTDLPQPLPNQAF